MAKKAPIVDPNASEETKGFPNKWLTKLPTGFKEEADALSEDDLKKVIVESEGNLYTIDKEKEADANLKKAKEDVKTLSGAYKDAVAAQNAKIKYSLFLLESRGVDLDSKN